MISKADLRNHYLNLRENLNSDFINLNSEIIINKIVEFLKDSKYEHIGIYYPFKGEPNILLLTELFSDKKFYFPKVVSDKEIKFVPYLNDLEKSVFNIKAPLNNNYYVPEIIFTPLICANSNFDRIGYGKGYYDNYFLKHQNVFKVGVLYNFQYHNFESEIHDQKLDLLIDNSLTNRSLILLASGKGNRIFKDSYKSVVRIFDKYLFEYSLSKFPDNAFLKIIILPEDKFLEIKKNPNYIYLTGSKTRFLSSIEGYKFAKGNYVYVHDAARVYTDEKDIFKLIDLEKNEFDFLSLCKNEIDTVRFKKNNKLIDKNEIIKFETPQVISQKLLPLILKYNGKKNDYFDEFEFIKKIKSKFNYHFLYSNSNNKKITFNNDLNEFKLSFNLKYKIGHSFDLHEIEESKPLILANLKLSNNFGLKAISDGDCILHAITESIFGALNMGDLGKNFSENDPINNNRNSLDYLNYTKKMLEKTNYSIINIDLILYYEGLKLNPHFDKIKANLVKLLETSNINLKATTSEKLGPIGDKKAIGCEAVILIARND